MEKIQKDKKYSVYEIYQSGVLGKRTYGTYLSRIRQDMIGNNILRAKIRDNGRRREYIIKGENLINFIKHENKRLVKGNRRR